MNNINIVQEQFYQQQPMVFNIIIVKRLYSPLQSHKTTINNH